MGVLNFTIEFTHTHKTTIFFFENKMSEENLLFIIDDQPGKEVSSEKDETFIPLFSSFKFILGLEDGEEADEDYYGKKC